MLLIVQIWDAQNQEVTRRVGATLRRIASKIAEVSRTERPQRLCRKQTRRPLWVKSRHRKESAECPLYPVTISSILVPSDCSLIPLRCWFPSSAVRNHPVADLLLLSTLKPSC